MQYDVAPLEGVTGYLFRNAHYRYFPGAHQYIAPFFSATQNHVFPPREFRDILPEHNVGVPVVPQIMTKRAEDFIWVADQLHQMGYGEVNLNLGCPSGTVTAKGKGSGFLAYPDLLNVFLEEIFAAAPLRISIKTRLGLRDAAEFPHLLEIFNRYPIAELTVHPRVREDFYRGAVRMEGFDYAAAHSHNPLCYNGDLTNPQQVAALASRYPQIQAIMIGRGVVANPGLITQLQGGSAIDKETLRSFLDTLESGYRQAFASDRNAMFRMKELWSYLIRLFQGGEDYVGKLRKAGDYREYAALVDEIFRRLELRAALPDACMSSMAIK